MTNPEYSVSDDLQKVGVHLEVADLLIPKERIVCLGKLGLDVVAITTAQAIETFDKWEQYHRDRHDSLIATFARKFGRLDTVHDAVIDELGKEAETETGDLARSAVDSLDLIMESSKTTPHSVDTMSDLSIIELWGLRSIAIWPSFEDKETIKKQKAIKDGDLSTWLRMESEKFEDFAEQPPLHEITDELDEDTVAILEMEMSEDEDIFESTVYNVARQLERELEGLNVSLRLYEDPKPRRT